MKVAKILDFGISKFAGAEDVSLTRTGTVMGSPLYMSPEQARGAKDINHATDLYSIGAIIYEALSGVPPFNGATYNEVIANVLMDKHKPLCEVKPEISPAISAVVDSLLAKSPHERPADARAAKSELRRAFAPGATDIDVPTVQHSEAGVGQPSTSARASIPPEAATRPAPDLPTAVVRAQRKVKFGVIGAGAVIVLAVGGFAVSRKLAQKAEEKPPLVFVAPPPAAPPPTPPPAPTRVKMTLLAVPADATWILDGETLPSCAGGFGCSVVRDAGTHIALVRAKGFVESRVEVHFDPAQEGKGFEVKLEPLPGEKGHPKRPARPDPVVHATEKPPEKKDPGAITIDKSNPFK